MAKSKMTDYFVSIIINSYNYDLFVARAIESCLSQTYPHLEVIVVDDGSTDQSCEIIRSYEPRITAILQDNSGQAATLNAGFLASKGDIIFCLDSDDYFLESKVAEIVSAYQNNPQIGWCFNSQSFVSSKSQVVLGSSAERESKVCDFRKDIQNGYLSFYPPATSGLSFRRELLNEIMPLPEEIGSYDRYLCWCALRLSPGFYLDKPLSVRLVHDRNLSGTSIRQSSKKARKTEHSCKQIMSSAFYIRSKYPELTRFCHSKFATGLGFSWKENYSKIANFWSKKYFSDISWADKLFILSLALYKSRPFKRASNYIPQTIKLVDKVG